MSNADRNKWEARYRRRRDAAPSPPSSLLVEAMRRIGRPPPGLVGEPVGERVGERVDEPLPRGARALDLACGSGRNALFLAQLAYRVDAVDVSAAGLALGQQRAAAQGLAINWIEADLESWDPGGRGYDLILMMRYLNLDCLRRMIPRLRPGGWLVAEVFLNPVGLAPVRDTTLSGPSNPTFLAAPGALRAACADLVLKVDEEGLVAASVGRSEALARVVAQRT